MKSFESKSDEFLDAIREKFFSNLDEAGRAYQDLLKIMLDVPPERTGKTYFNVKGKEKHTAAAPSPEEGGGEGEAPAPLSGELRDSVKFREGTTTDTQHEVYILSNKEYVLALEFGTDWMRPKPAWNKTLVLFKDELGDIALDGFYRR